MRTTMINPVDYSGNYNRAMERNKKDSKQYSIIPDDIDIINDDKEKKQNKKAGKKKMAKKKKKKGSKGKKKNQKKILKKKKGTSKRKKGSSKRKKGSSKKKKGTSKRKKGSSKKKKGTSKRKKGSSKKKKRTSKKKKGTTKKKSEKKSYFKVSNGVLKKVHPKHIEGNLVNPKKGKKKKGAKKMSKLWSNPAGKIKKSAEEVISIIPDTLYAGAGYLGTNIVINVLPFEAAKYNPMVRVPLKVISAVILSIGANMLNKNSGKYVLLGGMLNAIQDVVDTTNLQKFIPITAYNPQIEESKEVEKIFENGGHELITENEAGVIFNETGTGTIFE